jgi:hypothetical protein
MNHQYLRHETTRCASELLNVFQDLPATRATGTRARNALPKLRSARVCPFVGFDIQHAVLPTYLSLAEFYEELVETQRVLSIKHLGLSALREAAGLAAGRLLRGRPILSGCCGNLIAFTVPSSSSPTTSNQ